MDGAWPASEAFVLGVFACCESGVPFVAAVFDIQNLLTVEPMLDVVSFGDDAAAVPLADGIDWFVVGRCEKVVEGCGSVTWQFAVFVFLVVEDLVFESEVSLGSIFDAAIAAFGDLPFEA